MNLASVTFWMLEPIPRPSQANLLGYAIMGSVYAREVLKVNDPQVGIMSNGEEEEKGTAFTKENDDSPQKSSRTRRRPLHPLW